MKFWKNWKYWVKGGIIALGLYFLLFLIYYPFLKIGADSFFSTLIIIPGLYFCYITNNLTLDFGNVPLATKIWEISLLHITNVLVYFIIGAIIGWIYGKIKNRKQIIN